MGSESDRTVAQELLKTIIGVRIEILTDEYQEEPGSSQGTDSSHRITFRLMDEVPDSAAFGVLFALSLMSFTYALPTGYASRTFVPDEEFKLAYFLEGLHHKNRTIAYIGDFVAGRAVKTVIIYTLGGAVSLNTINRGRGAALWLRQLQGRKWAKRS